LERDKVWREGITNHFGEPFEREREPKKMPTKKSRRKDSIKLKKQNVVEVQGGIDRTRSKAEEQRWERVG